MSACCANGKAFKCLFVFRSISVAAPIIIYIAQCICILRFGINFHQLFKTISGRKPVLLINCVSIPITGICFSHQGLGIICFAEFICKPAKQYLYPTFRMLQRPTFPTGKKHPFLTLCKHAFHSRFIFIRKPCLYLVDKFIQINRVFVFTAVIQLIVYIIKNRLLVRKPVPFIPVRRIYIRKIKNPSIIIK